MKLYSLPKNVPFHWRLLEGLSTGTMTIAYLYSARFEPEAFLVFCIHWFLSFRYHQTYKEEDKEMDQLWIQFLSCERLAVCDPDRALLLRIVSFPGFLTSIPFSLKTLLVSTLCAVAKYHYLETCYQSGGGFGFWMLVSGFFFALNYPLLINQFVKKPYRLEERSRSPVLCLLFHIVIGLAVYNEKNGLYCSNIQPLYPRILDLLYYVLCSLFFF